MNPVPWRLIPPLALSGAMQMALDHWLLSQHRQGHQPPSLRFYTWDPPALSLGYHQQRWPSTWRSLTAPGQSLDLVRRPSGGRAVLHQGDLTYGLVTSGLGVGRSAAYGHLCQFLIQGWANLGIPLHYGQPHRDYGRNPHCFATATEADLLLEDGTKFIGSAQLWQGDAVLQHGSLALGLGGAPSLFRPVFGQPWPVSSCRDRAQAWGQDVIIASLTTAASQVFGITLLPQPLTATEWGAIDPGPWQL
ncbi:lipoate--protein ligase family protein [Prochlorothrix hollandica]|nr:lipoate--protein ligase family protein [Prochlorothrix hollandica]